MIDRTQWQAKMGETYREENSSKVSSSWWPERSLLEVLKQGRLMGRAMGACNRDRGTWGALKKPAGRTAREATRKMERDDMVVEN